ncbi:hypothetical protein RMSM_03909 [Rhodopirellula maiorica SM1]|uniref:Uncharacterized protein n=1 Tax=Rhodopirellula maiorica SM1 TaxID=1265738 RepID=M5RIN7_9BACT|nr:hypothetical protein RMSM_03909 [Rhodopirellula maiorica SM1]
MGHSNFPKSVARLKKAWSKFGIGCLREVVPTIAPPGRAQAESGLIDFRDDIF